MSLYDDLRKKLTPDQFTAVTDALGDDFDYDVVPRTRLNKVIRQRNLLRDQVEGVTQSSTKSAENEQEDDTDNFRSPNVKFTPGAAKVVVSKQVDEDSLRAQFEAEKQAMRVEFAALNKLREMDALDPELALTQIDLNSVTIEGGKLVGFDEQANALKENKSFLFKATRKRNDGAFGTGRESTVSEDSGGVSTVEDFMKLTTQEQLAFKEQHPETFKKFYSAM